MAKPGNGGNGVSLAARGFGRSFVQLLVDDCMTVLRSPEYGPDAKAVAQRWGRNARVWDAGLGIVKFPEDAAGLLDGPLRVTEGNAFGL